jgi:ribonuclease HI
MTNIITGAAMPLPSCITINTHGSCQTQRAAGAFGAIMARYIDGKLHSELERKGGATGTTSNRMELSAVISALKCIKRDEPFPIFILSASKYLVENWKTQVPGWIANGWLKTDGAPVLNVDLWQEIVRLCDGLEVVFEWRQAEAGGPNAVTARNVAAKQRKIWERKAVSEMFGEAA